MANPYSSIQRLIAENATLTERVKALEAENAAMRPVVEAVANTHSRLHCALGCRVNDRWNTEFHAPDCLITQARAFVAAHPTAGDPDAYDEAESEGE